MKRQRPKPVSIEEQRAILAHLVRAGLVTRYRYGDEANYDEEEVAQALRSPAAKPILAPYESRFPEDRRWQVALDVREHARRNSYHTSSLLAPMRGGRRYNEHPVAIFGKIRSARCFDHIDDDTLTKEVEENCHADYSGWYVTHRDPGLPPRGDSCSIGKHLLWHHGAKCVKCGTEQHSEEGYWSLFETGLCDKCILAQRHTRANRDQISAAAARELRRAERERQLEQHKKKLASDARLRKLEEEKSAKRAVKIAEDAKRRLLERAAYEAIEELGLLDIIKERVEA